MVIWGVGTHAANYVRADGRRFVNGSAPVQLVDHLLRRKVSWPVRARTPRSAARISSRAVIRKFLHRLSYNVLNCREEDRPPRTGTWPVILQRQVPAPEPLAPGPRLTHWSRKAIESFPPTARTPAVTCGIGLGLRIRERGTDRVDLRAVSARGGVGAESGPVQLVTIRTRLLSWSAISRLPAAVTSTPAGR